MQPYNQLRRYGLLGLIGLLIGAPLLAADTQTSAAHQAVQYRQDVFQLMKWHSKALAALIQGRVDYQPDQFKHHAEALAALSRMPLEGFTEASREAARASRLKDEMWYQYARFSDLFNQLQQASDHLATLAQATAKERRHAYGQVARQCKQCHDRFRYTQ